MQPMNNRTWRTSGLSVVEVLLVIVTVVLLVAAFLPALARPRHNGNRMRSACLNNLRMIGISFRLFSNDHQDKFPFALSNQLGGTLEFVNSPQVIRHFESMSNDLVTPQVLVCPSDPGRLRATNFLSPLGNQNVSYFVGLEADESKANRLLSGDRNITGGTLSNGFLRTLTPTTTAGWTTELHNNAGNVGLADGSVQQFTPALLRKQLQAQDLPVIRLAVP